MGALDLIRSELKDELKISFTDAHNLTRPGSPWRVGDKVRFDVALKNDAPVPLRNINGRIRHGDGTSFPRVDFHRADLAANSGWLIVANNVEVEITDDIDVIPFVELDLIAHVSLTAEADLSRVQISDGQDFLYMVLER